MNQQTLIDLKPQKEFFVGIDSDGCVFDTMEIKHKECFCPNFIRDFNLQVVSKFARETWEFVNLYSQTRGCNRFLAIVYVMEWLSKRADVKVRNAVIPDTTALSEWIKKETKLGNPALEKYVAETKDAFLHQTLTWSKNVNADIEKMVFGMPPFPYVRECLTKIQMRADAIVVSQTPYDALAREWEENKIAPFVRVIAGQELGTKTEHLKLATKGKYPDNKILMIGDAPGDLKVAKSNGVLFFPINPGKEDVSWEKLYNEGLDRFFSGTFEGDYEKKLIDEFMSYLPAVPAWK